MREIEAIKNSKLSPVEKGRLLKELITEGMTQQAVEKSIGRGRVIWNIREENWACSTVYYEQYALAVSFITRLGSDTSRFHEANLMEPDDVEAASP